MGHDNDKSKQDQGFSLARHHNVPVSPVPFVVLLLLEDNYLLGYYCNNISKLQVSL
jgi:hypothetical protein